MKSKLMIGLVILSCTGCQTNPLLKPSKGITTTIFPEYREYVKKDRKLKALDKEARYLNMQAYEALIERIEENK
jgi:hypothetical protein